MSKPIVSISYVRYPNEDFDDSEAFIDDITQHCELTISKEELHECGGELYDFILEIIQDFSLHELLKNYAEDALKAGFGFFAREIFQRIKKYFDRNKKLNPSILETRFSFRDANIHLHSFPNGSILENLEEISNLFMVRYLRLRTIIGEGKFDVHVPILFHIEKVDTTSDRLGSSSFEIPVYRVPLRWDETISEFRREDFYKLWGIRCNGVDYIYDVAHDRLTQERFYTDEEYWILWKEMYDRNT